MSAVAFDTYAAVKTLREAGADEAMAEAIVNTASAAVGAGHDQPLKLIGWIIPFAMMADEIHDKENVMIKATLLMLVGIATLIGSVATADDHKYQYVFSGMNHRGHHNILALSVSGDQAELDIEVTNRGGTDVGSVDSVTPIVA